MNSVDLKTLVEQNINDKDIGWLKTIEKLAATKGATVHHAAMEAYLALKKLEGVVQSRLKEHRTLIEKFMYGKKYWDKDAGAPTGAAYHVGHVKVQWDLRTLGINDTLAEQEAPELLQKYRKLQQELKEKFPMVVPVCTIRRVKDFIS